MIVNLMNRNEKMKSGFTLIELMIVIAIFGIISAIVLPAFFAKTDNNDNTGIVSNLSGGINGFVENRCISGYKFIIGSNGQVTQILNGQGRGIECFQ